MYSIKIFHFNMDIMFKICELKIVIPKNSVSIANIVISYTLYD